MKDLCPRGENIPVAVNPCPPAYVRIFKVGEMILIEHAYFFHDRESVDGRAGTAGKESRRLRIQFRALAFSPRKGPSERAVKITRIVHLPRVIHLQHFRLTGEYVFIHLDCTQKLLH